MPGSRQKVNFATNCIVRALLLNARFGRLKFGFSTCTYAVEAVDVKARVGGKK